MNLFFTLKKEDTRLILSNSFIDSTHFKFKKFKSEQLMLLIFRPLLILIFFLLIFF